MKKTKAAFEKLYQTYQKKRDLFDKKIKRWKEKNRTNLYRQGKELRKQADEYSRELFDFFKAEKHDVAQWGVARSTLKNFKRTYKELRELIKPVWRQWTEAIIVAALLAFILRTYVFGLYHIPSGSAEPTALVGERILGNKFTYFINEVQRGDLVIFERPGFVYDRSNPLKYFWQKYIGIPLPFLGLADSPENWVKRVIAVPGDVIEGKIEDGKTVVYLNEKKLEEQYVNPYPLIRVKKTVGFIKSDFWGTLPLLSFFRQHTVVRNYTYDPGKDLNNQPFYRLAENEVVRDLLRSSYIFEHPYTPNYSRFGEVIDNFGPYRIPEGKYWVMGDSRKNSEDSRSWGYLDKELILGRASYVIYSIDSEEPIWIFDFIKHPIDFWIKLIRWNRVFKKLQ